MDKFLNFGLLGVPVSVAIRYFWAKAQGVAFFEFASLEGWELWTYGVSVLLAVVWFWNVVIRTRCPECRSADNAYLGENELDRWVGTKKVTEQLGNGKSTTRSVSTTFEKIERVYRCSGCGHKWASASFKREKE